jgi:hypothetical protein
MPITGLEIKPGLENIKITIAQCGVHDKLHD